MILCSGCFNRIHRGHRAYLRAASRLLQGHEALAVAVAPDETILRKGRRVHAPQEVRVRHVRNLGIADVVYEQKDLEVAGLIRNLEPRVFVKGIDWVKRLPAEVVEACHDVQCLVVYVETPR